jgi:hypothetical protein
MTRIASILIVLVFIGCASSKKFVAVADRPLVEVLTQQAQGGANIRFYEVISTVEEFRLLQGDEHLKGKISADDLKTASFVLLSMGEKPSAGYSIEVERIEETPDSIILNIKESEPKAGEMNAAVISYPYTVIRINSKKRLEIK